MKIFTVCSDCGEGEYGVGTDAGDSAVLIFNDAVFQVIVAVMTLF